VAPAHGLVWTSFFFAVFRRFSNKDTTYSNGLGLWLQRCGFPIVFNSLDLRHGDKHCVVWQYGVYSWFPLKLNLVSLVFTIEIFAAKRKHCWISSGLSSSSFNIVWGTFCTLQAGFGLNEALTVQSIPEDWRWSCIYRSEWTGGSFLLDEVPLLETFHRICCGSSWRLFVLSGVLCEKILFATNEV